VLEFCFNSLHVGVLFKSWHRDSSPEAVGHLDVAPPGQSLFSFSNSTTMYFKFHKMQWGVKISYIQGKK
jgi:hypothetical protein